MISSKAVEILKTFSIQELKAFKAFLKSPYFNTNKNLISLYHLILKHFDNIDTEEITEEFVYENIFKGKKYNYGIFKNLLSELNKLAEEFLIVNANKSDYNRISSLTVLLNQLEARMLDNTFLSKAAKAERIFKNQKADSNFDENYTKLLDSMYNFHLNRSDLKNESDVLTRRAQYTFGSIINRLFQETVSLYAAERSINKAPETNLLKEFLKHFDNNSFLQYLKALDDKNFSHYIVRLQAISLFISPDRNDKLYFELKANILGSREKFSNFELYSLLNSVLMAYCEKRSSGGEAAFHNERYEILKAIFSFVKFKSEGVGSVFLPVYIDFITLTLKKGDVHYAESFALNFRKDLDRSKQKTGYNLAKAYIAFTKKEYEECLKYLSKTGHIDFHFKLRIKFLYLKVYYNLDLIEEGLSLLDSFRHFVKDTAEIHPQFRKILNDSIKYHTLLFKFKANPVSYTVKDYDEFLHGVGKSRILQKQWYIEEAENLKLVAGGSKRKIKQA